MKKNYLEPEFDITKFQITNDLMMASAETPNNDAYDKGDELDL